MISWLTKKKMTGGLVFGPPGWHPERIEETFDSGGEGNDAAAAAARVFPEERAAQIAILGRINVARTSVVVPALVDQLSGPQETFSPTLVLNLLPTQPEFAIGSAMSQLAIGDLLTGLEALGRIGARRTWVVLDRHDFKLRRLWKRALRARRRTKDDGAAGDSAGGGGGKITLRSLLNRYPQGDPTILVRALFGRRLPVGAMPTRVGVLMVDPVTCWALGRWLRTGQTLTDRPVQIFPQGSANPRLVLGRIGEPLAAFCQRHQVAIAGQQVIINGMLAGREVDAATARIEATTESVTVRERPDLESPAACVACGWCVDVCPTALSPIHLMQLAGKPSAKIVGSKDARESLHCIACGLCSYVCPTRLPLMTETLRLRELVTAAQSPSKPETPA